MARITIEELANFCKKKGFVYPSAEIYGGLSGFFDFGPLGAELKRNIRNEWWRFHVQERGDVVGIDGSIITHPAVWKASGHLDKFVDLIVANKKTKEKKKIDRHELKLLGREWTLKGEFNPMFSTNVGPVKEESLKAYLRPETAQSIFSNFKLVQENSRLKLPFGIAQIGKAFRNEIAPRNFLFRTREFEQMELEYFVHPKKINECEMPENLLKIKVKMLTAGMQKKKKKEESLSFKEAIKKGLFKVKWHAYWLSTELSFFKMLGADLENFRIRQHTEDEKSHYSQDTWDIEYSFPFGWRELEGIADRGTFDLESHEKASKKDLKMQDEGGEKVLPRVIAEPSLGLERAFTVFMLESYSINEKGFTVLKLNPRLAPVKAAVLPLVKKEKSLVELSKRIYNELKKEANVTYDESASIGRRYARNDEIGTPFCITVDNESEKNQDATIRNRDDGLQKRIKIKDMPKILRDLSEEKIKFKDL